VLRFVVINNEKVKVSEYFMDYSRLQNKTPKELSYFVAATIQEAGLYIILERSRVMQWRQYVEQVEGCKIGVSFILNPELFEIHEVDAA
jgi:hypothetical protein